MAESVEHGSRVRETVHCNSWSSQTKDLYNVDLSLPSQVFGIIRIGLGLVGSVSRYCVQV